jgi:hypothetical protein
MEAKERPTSSATGLVGAALLALWSTSGWCDHWTGLGEPNWDEHPHKVVAVQYQYVGPHALPNIPAVGFTTTMDEALAKITLLTHAYAKSLGFKVTDFSVDRRGWQFISDHTGCGLKVRVYDSEQCADAGLVYQTYVYVCFSPISECGSATANRLWSSIITRIYYNLLD